MSTPGIARATLARPHRKIEPPVEKFRYCSLTSDQSAEVLTGKIQRKEPFFFVRYGDGAIECISGKPGQTRDFEVYSRALGADLLSAWGALMSGANIYVGDWQSASFDTGSEYARYAKEYAALIGTARPTFLHFEALLLMRETTAVADFYRAVKADTRRKLFMGPAANAGAAKMLGAEFLETPMRNLFAHSERLTEELMSRDFDVMLYGAGMAGTIPAVRCWERFPERTYVNIGSSLDPLFMGRTRLQQLHPAIVRGIFMDLL